MLCSKNFKWLSMCVPIPFSSHLKPLKSFEVITVLYLPQSSFWFEKVLEGCHKWPTFKMDSFVVLMKTLQKQKEKMKFKV